VLLYPREHKNTRLRCLSCYSSVGKVLRLARARALERRKPRSLRPLLCHSTDPGVPGQRAPRSHRKSIALRFRRTASPCCTNRELWGCKQNQDSTPSRGTRLRYHYGASLPTSWGSKCRRSESLAGLTGL